MTHSLSIRAKRASLWLAVGNLGSQALRLVSSLILTRLLMPEAFGLVGVVNLLYFVLTMFSDMGITQSVVKSHLAENTRYLGTAYTIQLLRGVLLAFIVLLLAAALWWGAHESLFESDSVYADNRLPWMMASFAICALIQGAESMKLALLQRQLNGSVQAKIEFLTQLATTIVTILLVLLFHSPWSLLFGTVIGGALRTISSHLYMPGPSITPVWDVEMAREIIGFGKWIFVSTIIGFLGGHGEKLILSACLAAGAFGVFTIASNLLAAVVGVYSTVNGRVVFPMLSEVVRSQGTTALSVAYERAQKIVDWTLGSLAGLLLVTGQWIVHFLYDARYADAGWMLSLLGLGLVAMRYQVLEQLMFAKSEPAWVATNNGFRALALFIVVPISFRFYGETGAIVGVVISQYAAWPLSIIFKKRHGLLSLKSEAWWLPALGLGSLVGYSIHVILSALYTL